MTDRPLLICYLVRLLPDVHHAGKFQGCAHYPYEHIMWVVALQLQQRKRKGTRPAADEPRLEVFVFVLSWTEGNNSRFGQRKSRVSLSPLFVDDRVLL